MFWTREKMEIASCLSDRHDNNGIICGLPGGIIKMTGNKYRCPMKWRGGASPFHMLVEIQYFDIRSGDGGYNGSGYMFRLVKKIDLVTRKIFWHAVMHRHDTSHAQLIYNTNLEGDHPLFRPYKLHPSIHKEYYPDNKYMFHIDDDGIVRDIANGRYTIRRGYDVYDTYVCGPVDHYIMQALQGLEYGNKQDLMDALNSTPSQQDISNVLASWMTTVQPPLRTSSSIGTNTSSLPPRHPRRSNSFETSKDDNELTEAMRASLVRRGHELGRVGGGGRGRGRGRR